MRIRIDHDSGVLTLYPDDDSEIAWLREMHEAVDGGGTITVNRDSSLRFSGSNTNGETST